MRSILAITFLGEFKVTSGSDTPISKQTDSRTFEYAEKTYREASAFVRLPVNGDVMLRECQTSSMEVSDSRSFKPEEGCAILRYHRLHSTLR